MTDDELASFASQSIMGWVAIDSWAGRSTYLVERLGETPKRYRVRWHARAPGHPKGSVSLVPKSACRWLLPGEYIGCL